MKDTRNKDILENIYIRSMGHGTNVVYVRETLKMFLSLSLSVKGLKIEETKKKFKNFCTFIIGMSMIRIRILGKYQRLTAHSLQKMKDTQQRYFWDIYIHVLCMGPISHIVYVRETLKCFSLSLSSVSLSLSLPKKMTTQQRYF